MSSYVFTCLECGNHNSTNDVNIFQYCDHCGYTTEWDYEEKQSISELLPSLYEAKISVQGNEEKVGIYCRNIKLRDKISFLRDEGILWSTDDIVPDRDIHKAFLAFMTERLTPREIRLRYFEK